ncbi:MAG: response regulator [Clostridia bacterium]|nr:response regulator [Clostridia bacterium]
MNVICVDDEELVLQLTVSLCRDIPEVSEIEGFSYVQDALDWLSGHRADAALLDIDMPEMNGLQLAAKIKEIQPDVSVIFLTGYPQYAVDAFAMHASGYLMKPVTKDQLREELLYAGSLRKPEDPAHVQAVTFGNFDLLVDGRPITFSRSKSKELLAYLIDRQGSSVSRSEAFAALWEDSLYDRSMQKQLDVVLRSLRTTLEENGVGDILEVQKGQVRIRPECIRCDLYRFMAGDIDAVNSYRGEYMNAYSWAELTEAYLERKLGG